MFQTSSPALQPKKRPPMSLGPLGRRHSIGSCNTIPDEKRHLDITQRLERKLAGFNASGNIFKRWILEITCWTISALCMAAVAGIYARVNGKSMSGSEWLLTWVNVLGKIAAAALIIPTSEALGQLKWSWFHKSRTMWDFEIFDKASRGPWGAVMLLFRTRGCSLAAFGALIIVLLLAIDTFFQQVVEYPNRWRLTDAYGEIPRTIQYEPRSPPQFFQKSEQVIYNKELLPVLREYFSANGSQPVPFGNGTRPDIPLSCPTGNCTWPVYNTLAVCSRCEEVSAFLDITQTCLMTSVDWSANWTGPITEEPYPNKTVCGHFLNATSEQPILLTGYIVDHENESTIGEVLLMRTIPLTDFDTKEPKFGAGSVVFKEVRNPLLDALIISALGGRHDVLLGRAPLVHDCILSWCVQTIKSSYDRGIYHQNVISEFWNTTDDPIIWPWEAKDAELGVVDLTYWQNITIQPPPLSTTGNAEAITYSVSNATALEVMTIFDDFFPSSYTAENSDTQPLLRYRNYFNGPFTHTLDFNPWQAPNNLTRYMERIAISMTNVIRSSISKAMLHGDAYEVEKYVLVKWEWLIFPFALLLLTLIFLVATIIRTSKDAGAGMEIWKTSAMPTLIYGLPEEVQKNLNGHRAVSSEEKGTAKKVRIQLLPHQGWRVSGYTMKSPVLARGLNHQAPPGWI